MNGNSRVELIMRVSGGVGNTGNIRSSGGLVGVSGALTPRELTYSSEGFSEVLTLRELA